MEYSKFIFDDNEKIYVPNEIFSDLKELISFGPHIAFAYSFYCLICYCFRYCKYIYSSNNLLTVKDIKEALGYHPNNKVLDNIIKKGGILDRLGYTESTTNYPLRWEFIEEEGGVCFYCINDLKRSDYIINDRNHKIKYPIKAFHRREEDVISGSMTGTFYDVLNTHEIPMTIIRNLIEENTIDVNAFYIYGYLKHMCERYHNKYNVTYPAFTADTGLSDKTLAKYLKQLEMSELIHIKHEKFTVGAEEKNRKANTYSINYI